MFTSRAEYRIFLRQDNADIRLTEKSFKLGLASERRMQLLTEKYKKITAIEKFLRTESITPDEINDYLEGKKLAKIKQKVKIEALIQRPQLSLNELSNKILKIKDFINTVPRNAGKEELDETEILVKYNLILKKERPVAEKIGKFEEVKIPQRMDFHAILSISSEEEKSLPIRPETIGQASRISGVSPSDIAVLIVCLGK